MCDFPYSIRNPRYGRLPNQTKMMDIPCGKCYKCVMRRSAQWYVRLHYENRRALSSHFVTLTYDDAPRSFNGLYTGVKADLQNYFKRLRKREQKNRIKKITEMGVTHSIKSKDYPIRYYACLEYGSKLNRPHYHIIMFNVFDPNNIHRAWSIDGKSLGIVDSVPDINSAMIRYVTGYIGKKIGIPVNDYDDRLPEFSLMSKNLGDNYLSMLGNWHKDKMAGFTDIKGIKYALPRYYKDKLFPHEYQKELVVDWEKRSFKVSQTIKKYNNDHIKISELNNAVTAKALDKAEKDFNSFSDFEKNRAEIAIRNNQRKTTINNSKF